MSILIALCILYTTNIPDGCITALIACTIHIVGFLSYRQESPTVTTFVPTVATWPRVWRNQGWQYGTTDSKRRIPSTLVVTILIVYFPDALLAPFSTLLPYRGKVVYEAIIACIADDVLHILQCLRIACLIILIHHHLGIHHVTHRLRHATAVLVIPAHRQDLRIDYGFQLDNKLAVNLISFQLRSSIRT